jgi:hypothetical protein
MKNAENVGKLRKNLDVLRKKSSAVKPTNQELLSLILRPFGEKTTLNKPL